jgi:hypothetical protein
VAAEVIAHPDLAAALAARSADGGGTFDAIEIGADGGGGFGDAAAPGDSGGGSLP